MTRRSLSFSIMAATAPWQNLLASDAAANLIKVAETYDSLRSYYFEGTAVTTVTIKGKSSESRLGFVVAYTAPDKFRLAFTYPDAGTWLRVSDGKYLVDTRTKPKDYSRTPATDRSINLLKGSPIQNFRRLSKTAENSSLLRTEPVESNGGQVDCDVIQFTSHRRELRDNERPGPSSVWIAKASSLVLKEEIRTIAERKGETSESMRTTSITRFRMNEEEPDELFSTAGGKK